MENEVNIRREDLSIGIDKINRIYELSKNPIFIHKKYNNRGKLSRHGKKPNYSKIAKELGIRGNTVSTYLNGLHKKYRKYSNKKEEIKRRIEYRQRPKVKKRIKEWQQEYDKTPEKKLRRKKLSKKIMRINFDE